jgi:hypothetical protein
MSGQLIQTAVASFVNPRATRAQLPSQMNGANAQKHVILGFSRAGKGEKIIKNAKEKMYVD